jgi:hypothetical protein
MGGLQARVSRVHVAGLHDECDQARRTASRTTGSPHHRRRFTAGDGNARRRPSKFEDKASCIDGFAP